MATHVVRWLVPFAALTAALAACSAADRPPRRDATSEPSGRAERLGAQADALSAAKLHGASLPPKTLALTFDDGPAARTAELSAYLGGQGIAAAFFVNGARITSTTLPNPGGMTPIAGAGAILAQLAADGHLVANHTTTHRDLVTEVLPTGAARVVQELAETDAAIGAYVPASRFLFRPPYGSWSTATYDALRVSAMDKYVGPVDWEIGGTSNGYPNAAADWACWQGRLYAGGSLANGTGYATTTQCGDAYVREIDAVGRGIVLLHDPYGYAGGSTVDMVAYIVPILKAKGYAFVRLDEVPAIAALLPCDATCATCSGPAPTQCTSCEPGRWLGGGRCRPCSTCAAGTYTAAACTPTSNTACSACHPTCATCTGPGAGACTSCGAGSYLNGGACAGCSACGPGSYQASACTANGDTICAACHPSCAACSGPNVDQCGACPDAYYLDGGFCRACTVCAAGSAAVTACSAAADTTCAPCPEGTFAGAGATSCSSCGTCDDDDPCTADRCDAAVGCTHASVAGCGASDAGAGDGGAGDAGARDGGAGDAGAGDGGGTEPRPDPLPDPRLEPGADPRLDAGDDGGCGVARGDGPRGETGGVALAAALSALALRRRRRGGRR